MSEYPTSSAVQDLALRIEALTFETSGIGHQLGRIADHLTGQSTGFGPPAETTAPDSVQSQGASEPVDPEDPSWAQGDVAYAEFKDGSGGERAIRTHIGWHGERGRIVPESYFAYHFYRMRVEPVPEAGDLPTLATVEAMMFQISVDRTTPYWADRSEHLDSVQSYLDSLKEHLS